MKSSVAPLRVVARDARQASSGFTLVELLAVIAIMTILMTMGLIGVKNLTTAKGTIAVVANAEALFEEARLIATSKATTARVIVSIDTSNHGDESLRRILVAYRPLDPATGRPDTSRWELASRSYLMPEGVYFSDQFSSKLHPGGGKVDSDTFTFPQSSLSGEYRYYEFSAEGICSAPGSSFIIATGARPKTGSTYQSPRVTGSAKRDFAGFVIWRNGRTSTFRHPEQIGIPTSVTTF